MKKKINPIVGIIMGSDSDMSVMEQAGEVLNEFGIEYEYKITSAHRTPDLMAAYSKNAYKRGIKVIIAGAGGSAHLPGMCAAYSPLPVIGVPVNTKSLQGLDSLLSIVQMPFGVPVATVAINNSKNAALLAAQIIGISDKKILAKVISFKEKIRKESLAKNKKLI
ncbi:MAG TPA: 5-(carboxyamino)imidazole ribonucleotide mutase [Ignavibacteria bacterium]|nr:5-(carboxyamino)imidazole ribonucleotide mutase [Ignavibacteria bacterium]HQY51829.1 5-(carboxyamino)imidazole ribonucleotide mutase [Ignavibacteria bacterium]HRB01615.1 5-(carboxyamino)imidazole ribonucleotide mutase [Ignavibacteria bacterium]